ncbi:MAG: HTH-type transcriptional regulator TsaR [Paracidovorax wautersii]|uniref:HTH-type transcriptional regulator TsaR n=1 Tax=Paracidovorax wautersii TaxID=1177982 RepID=A0A7V8FS16_9BURK|nr:MAG: HTH-type transcriptional regulator TsaR [Paracidovorax wautersii]
MTSPTSHAYAGDPPRPSIFPASLLQLRALRAFLAVVAHGTTTAASAAIHVSQPSVTRAVNQLEAHFEHALFIRTTRGMVPTPQGAQLAARVRVLLDQLGAGAREAVAADFDKAAKPHGPERFAQRVTPSQLRALVTVALYGSESQAALRLGVSQPAVNLALQSLETLLGVRLYYKLTSGTRLTPAGEALLLRVKQSVAEIRGIESDVSAWHGNTQGQIVVGILPLSVPIFLPLAVEELARQQPKVSVQIVDGTYENLIAQLLSADVGVVAGALRSGSPAQEVQQQHLFDDDLVIVARRGHPCLSLPRPTLQDLLGWPWVTPLPGTPADRALTALFGQYQLPSPSHHLCASSPTMTLAFVLQSGCLAIASRGQVLMDDHGGHVQVVPLPLPASTRPIGLALRSSSQPSPELQAFLDACQSAVRSLSGRLRPDR